MSQKYSSCVFILWQLHTHRMNLWSLWMFSHYHSHLFPYPITVLNNSPSYFMFFFNSLSLTLTSCMNMSWGIIYQNRSIFSVPAINFPSPSVMVDLHEPTITLPKSQMKCWWHQSCTGLMHVIIAAVISWAQHCVISRKYCFTISGYHVLFFSFCHLSSESLKEWHRCSCHG